MPEIMHPAKTLVKSGVEDEERTKKPKVRVATGRIWWRR
jgi:hypothetical protein